MEENTRGKKKDQAVLHLSYVRVDVKGRFTGARTVQLLSNLGHVFVLRQETKRGLSPSASTVYCSFYDKLAGFEDARKAKGFDG